MECQGTTLKGRHCGKKTLHGMFCHLHKDQEPIEIDLTRELPEELELTPEEQLMIYNDIQLKPFFEKYVKTPELPKITTGVSPAESTKQECQICCFERDNFVYFECMHSMCSECFPNIRDNICPFCRTKIRNLTPEQKRNIKIRRREDRS